MSKGVFVAACVLTGILCSSATAYQPIVQSYPMRVEHEGDQLSLLGPFSEDLSSVIYGHGVGIDGQRTAQELFLGDGHQGGPGINLGVFPHGLQKTIFSKDGKNIALLRESDNALLLYENTGRAGPFPIVSWENLEIVDAAFTTDSMHLYVLTNNSIESWGTTNQEQEWKTPLSNGIEWAYLELLSNGQYVFSSTESRMVLRKTVDQETIYDIDLEDHQPAYESGKSRPENASLFFDYMIASPDDRFILMWQEWRWTEEECTERPDGGLHCYPVPRTAWAADLFDLAQFDFVGSASPAHLPRLLDASEAGQFPMNSFAAEPGLAFGKNEKNEWVLMDWRHGCVLGSVLPEGYVLSDSGTHSRYQSFIEITADDDEPNNMVFVSLESLINPWKVWINLLNDQDTITSDDANGDGIVDAADIILARNVEPEWPPS